MTAVTVVNNRKAQFVRFKKVHLIFADEAKTLCGYSVSPLASREEHLPVTFVNKVDYNWNSDVCKPCLIHKIVRP